MRMGMKIAALALVFWAGRVAVGGEAISLAERFPDPGFERPHEPRAQINAPGVRELNGWSAKPAGGNFWTSLSYVDRGVNTLGENRPGIEPAEGDSYLRMYTFKSHSWLRLLSPAVALNPGDRVRVAFSLAADRSTPMASLQVGLRKADDSGEILHVQSYDLIHLEEGWNTIVYEVEYLGPAQEVRLLLNAAREKDANGGSLNFDHFRDPTAEDRENALKPKKSSSPSAGGNS